MSYVTDHQAGVAANSAREVCQILSSWLGEDGRLLQQYARNARQLGKPDAAYRIADEAWQAAHGDPHREPDGAVEVALI